MRVEEFDFSLPEERIALRPSVPRDGARLLHVPPQGGFCDNIMRDLPKLVRPSDVLIVNDTKVLPVRLAGRRVRAGMQNDKQNDRQGARIEATLIEQIENGQWRSFVKPAKKLKTGDKIDFGALQAELMSCTEGIAILDFHLPPQNLDVALAACGAMPLPPYIASRRAPDAQDIKDYQTMFATHKGAIAAPTAGLHFTPDLYNALTAQGVEVVRVTLHVGAGTFLPVKAEDTDAHNMHSEWGQIEPEAATRLNRAKAQGGRLICVGTTSLRLLETAAQADGTLAPFSGLTDIFITPGYRFKAADCLLTNFHLPKSTLFMLVAAFCGLTRMREAYAHAIATGYRFYSYGDGCFLERPQ